MSINSLYPRPGSGLKTLCLAIVLLITSPIMAAPEEKGPELASVVILEFANQTGSKDYNWLKTSLPDGIHDSMKDRFEFIRTGKDQIRQALGKRGKKTLDLSSDDARSIAKISKSDIIISGNYTYNKKTNKIAINAAIYHVSRNSVTAKLDIKTAVDSTLFNVVDKVAEKIITHIGRIATEDLKIPTEKTPDNGKKPKKIVLQKAKAFEYDPWYMEIWYSYQVPVGTLSDGVWGGTGLGAAVYNSYNSFLHFGGSFVFQAYFHVDKNSEGSDSDNNQIASFFPMLLRAHFGVNFMFFNRIVLEPYLAGGYSLTIMERETKGLADSEYSRTSEIFGNPVLSIGVKCPIRLWGIFLSPFVEYTQIFDSDEFMGFFCMGLGVAF